MFITLNITIIVIELLVSLIYILGSRKLAEMQNSYLTNKWAF